MPDPVLVVGAGPVGLTLACELARHGVDCRVVDRLPEPLPYCRAIGVTPRTLEVWDDMGLAGEAIDAGLWLTGLRSIVHGHPSQDTAKPDLGLPYAELGLPQYETERLLLRQAARHGIEVERGVTLTALSQDEGGVTVELQRDGAAAPEVASFAHVVGCDGAHSAVRRALGIDFAGEAYPWPFMLGDVQIGWDVPYGMAVRALRLVPDAPPDMFIAIPLPEKGRYRVSMLAPAALVGEGGTGHGIQAEMKGPSLADLQAVAGDLLPDRPRLSDMRWSSIFRISMRLAARYRVGRVFIAGDAAHIHPPTGGQGMNTGIQDAYNLAWKLALVIRGVAGQALLDTYESERRPVGQAVVARTQAASENYGREAGAKPDKLADTQIDISYRAGGPAGDGLPGAGDRAPDANGLARPGVGYPLRLFDLLRGTGHVLLVHGPLDAAEKQALATWRREARPAIGSTMRIVVVVPADDAAEAVDGGVAIVKDALGSFGAAYGSAPTALLVRPDGYIAWRGDTWRDGGLGACLDTVFGTP